VAVSWHEALAAAAAGLRGGAPALATGPTDAGAGVGVGSGVGVIGGARLTNEGAYAWARLAKGVLGTDSVDAQLGDGLPAELVLGLPAATIEETVNAGTVVLLTGDVRDELPVLFLRLRGAALSGGTSIVELSPRSTSLTPYAAASLRYVPGQATGLVGSLFDGSEAGDRSLAEARRLVAADDVVVVAGRPSLAEDGALVAEALGALAAALPKARFLCGLRRGNVRGALDMGLAPGVLPGRVSLEEGREWFVAAWGRVPDARGLDTAGMLAAAAGADGDGSADKPIRALVLLGAEPLRDFPDRRLARRALDGAEFVVAVTSQPGGECDIADVILPAAEAHERRGTTTNIEGRVNRLGHKLVAPGQAWPDWMIAAELAVHLGSDLGVDSLAAVWDEIERLAPSYAGLTGAMLDAVGAADGVIAPLAGPTDGQARLPSLIDPIAIPGVESVERQGAPPRAGLAEPPDIAEEEGVARPATQGGLARPTILSAPPSVAAPHVGPTDSYSLRLVASRTLYDEGAANSASPALAALVQPASLRVNPSDLDDLGVAAGGEVRIRTANAEAVVVAIPDPSLPPRVVATVFNVPLGESTVADLIDSSSPVVELRMETP
jgi:NADH-quinone oxidoreductase subunit G